MYFAYKRSTCIFINLLFFFDRFGGLKAKFQIRAHALISTFSLSSACAKKSFRRRPDNVAHALLKEHSDSSACAK